VIDYANALSEEKLEICKSKDDLLIQACPGSGKTRTIIYKFAYIIENNPNSLRRLVAITYTNRAADEIQERIEGLGIDTQRIWAGTIHQFCIEWILKRFKMYLTSLSCGFRIIDERVKQRYLEDIIAVNGKSYYWEDINTSYTRELKLIEQDTTKRKIIKQYHNKLLQNKELDFNLILALAHKILVNNLFAASYIKDAIELICIDEYQDTQDLQYAIIEDIANAKGKNNLKINFYGDPNQAIYGSLGGIAKDIFQIQTEFKENKFKEITLSGCYRSTQRIIDFYKEFMVTTYPIEGRSKIKNLQGVISYNHTIHKNSIYDYIAQIIEQNIDSGIEDKEICVLAPTWKLLFPFSNELKSRLPNVQFDAPDITPIKRDPLNLFYNLSRLLLTEPNIRKFNFRKMVARDILKRLNEICGDAWREVDEIELLNIVMKSKIRCEKGSEFVKKGIELTMKSLMLNIQENMELVDMYTDFIEKMDFRLNQEEYCLVNELDTFKKMFKEKEGVVINTCHGVKGEEYKTVIAFGLVYGKVPNVNTEAVKQNDEANKLLYVIASRAKENLYLFSEQGRVYWDSGLRSRCDAFPTRQLFQNTSVTYNDISIS
jgi:DNA helicase II / ATP-dependent DNA helicase PcrA